MARPPGWSSVRLCRMNLHDGMRIVGGIDGHNWQRPCLGWSPLSSSVSARKFRRLSIGLCTSALTRKQRAGGACKGRAGRVICAGPRWDGTTDTDV
mmetsp:Transcript_113064/g.324981  ORF Transcript_113064/g.324981 Transcript_113064/m.324981 type:complete len:96 (-) Transcript_113064:107-394(-)